MSKAIDLTGQRFGELTALSRCNSVDGSTRSSWNCRCSCGTTTVVRTSNLRSGNTRGCTHCKGKRVSEARRTHGCTLDQHFTKEYHAWRNMIRRCECACVDRYASYGGRGVTVCARWRNSFETFLEDVGYAPTPEHTLDRIDVNASYEPNNVRWATRKQQARNKQNTILVEFDGALTPLIDLAERHNVPYSRVVARYRKGWSVSDAIFTPPRKRTLTYHGETKPLSVWARKIGVRPELIAARLRAGWSVERALTTPVYARNKTEPPR